MQAPIAVAVGNVVHIHATRVVDRGSGLALDLFAIPIASLESRPRDLAGVAEALELEIIREAPVPAASFLPHAVSAVLLASEPDEAAGLFEDMITTPPSEGLEIDPVVLNFATYCAFAHVVGVEESPLRATVLAAIVAAGGSVALATMAAIAAPVVVVVGAGIAAGAGTIVVFSTAAGAGERLYRKISG